MIRYQFAGLAPLEGSIMAGWGWVAYKSSRECAFGCGTQPRLSNESASLYGLHMALTHAISAEMWKPNTKFEFAGSHTGKTTPRTLHLLEPLKVELFALLNDEDNERAMMLAQQSIDNEGKRRIR